MAMASIAMLALPMAMATTQFKPKMAREFFVPIHFEHGREPQAPRMNWVVVTDNHGCRRLRIQWTAVKP
jgi:hypothetical protein